MDLDYSAIGSRIAKRRKELHLTQAAVAERCDISDQYLSNIERAVSIPSTEVIMRLAVALNTTPNQFLIGTACYAGEDWRDTAELLRGMEPKRLAMAKSLLLWLIDQQL